jgi:LysM repeat protein
VPLPTDAAVQFTPPNQDAQAPGSDSATPGEATAAPPTEFSPDGTVTVVTADGQIQQLAADPTGGTAPQTSSSLEHIVQPGDTLSKIATFYGVTTRDLQWWNGIKNPNTLSVGQTVYLYERAGLPPKEEFFSSIAAERNQSESRSPASTSSGLEALAGGTRAPAPAAAPPPEPQKPKKTLGGAIKGLFKRIRD